MTSCQIYPCLFQIDLYTKSLQDVTALSESLQDLDYTEKAQAPFYKRVISWWQAPGTALTERLQQISKKAESVMLGLQQATDNASDEEQKKELDKKFKEITADFSHSLVQLEHLTLKFNRENRWDVQWRFQEAKDELKNAFRKNALQLLEKFELIFSDEFLKETTRIKANHWLEEFSPLFSQNFLQSLPEDLTIQLAALLCRFKKILPKENLLIESVCSRNYRQIKNRLPDYAQNYLHILNQEGIAVEQIERIERLLSNNEQSSAAGTAYFININKISLKDMYYKDPLQKIKLLKLAPYLTYLDFREFPSCEDIIFESALIEKCSNIKFLYINNKKLKSLPPLPSCLKLDCSGCTSLEVLSELSSCIELDCSGCTALPALPELLKCAKIDCHKCRSLLHLSCLPNCKDLNCSQCPSLQSIGSLPVCKMLLCYRCTNLESLPPLPNCREIDCSYCKSLKFLLELSNCRKLTCEECDDLQQISDLPSCEELDCKKCLSLQILPRHMGCCRRIDCTECPNLQQIPEVPLSASVYHDNAASIPGALTLTIDVNELATNPKKYLLELGENYLLEKKAFPKIYYSEKGKMSEAVDIGGVRRDFVTKLFSSLEKGSLIPIFSDKEKGVWLTMDSDPETKTCLQILGRLFVLCYEETCGFKSGEIFSQNFFDALKIFEIDLLSERALIQALILVKGLPRDVERLISGKLSPSKVDNKTLKTLSCFLNEEIEGDLIEWFSEKENQQHLKAAILEQAKEDKRIAAASIVAAAMRKSMSSSAWDVFCSEDLLTSSKKIQGELDAKQLIAKLQWSISTGETSSIEFKRVQGFLLNWINKASKNQLRNFTQFVTGNRTLGMKNLTIEFYRRGPNYMPVAHTCFFSLELSTKYPSQLVFDKKLEESIIEGLAGSGFQFS